MKIHPNLESAVEACKIYMTKTEKLREELGVWEENEDSCCAIYICAKYLDS